MRLPTDFTELATDGALRTMEPNAAENAWKLDLSVSVCRLREIAMAAGSSSKRVIYAALAGNPLIALTKLVGREARPC